MLDDVAALVWAANLAALEFHAPMARAADPESPTLVVFDLDPGAPAAMTECCQVALDIRDVLAAVDLVAWAKTSGSKGLQLYVPLNSPHSHDDASDFAPPWPNCSAQAAQAGHQRDGQGVAPGQGLHRLEPELPSQDHHRGYSLRARPSRRCPPR